MFQKITDSLNAMMRSESVAETLKEKMLGFMHRGPVEEQEGEQGMEMGEMYGGEDEGEGRRRRDKENQL